LTQLLTEMSHSFSSLS